MGQLNLTAIYGQDLAIWAGIGAWTVITWHTPHGDMVVWDLSKFCYVYPGQVYSLKRIKYST